MNVQKILVAGFVQLNDKVLLLKQSKSFFENGAEKWEPVLTEVEFGQSPNEAITKAIENQTGIKVVSGQLISKFFNQIVRKENDSVQLIIIGFKCSPVNKETALSKANASLKWFNANELKYVNACPQVKELLQGFA